MVNSRLLRSESKLPLLVEPDSEKGTSRDPDYLIQWATDERPWIEQKLLEHGALLFRGFDLRSAEDFERFASVISPRFMGYVRGISPRTKVNGNVYTSTDAGSHMPIPLHCELAYTSIYPAKVFFFCQQPPSTGGETPIASTRAIYEQIRPDVRDRFIEKRLRFVQNVVSAEKGTRKQSWQALFETTERELVEDACRAQSIDFQWMPDGDLQLVGTRPAAIDHPQTGETVWFNNMQLMHDTWSWELRRVRNYRAYLPARCRELIKAAILSIDDYPKQCVHADSTPLRRSDVYHIRDAHWKEAVMFPWQKGDVLVADNILTAHGRMPFTGQRKILAMLGAAAKSE